jgi:hypothetical protein
MRHSFHMIYSSASANLSKNMLVLSQMQAHYQNPYCYFWKANQWHLVISIATGNVVW